MNRNSTDKVAMQQFFQNTNWLPTQLGSEKGSVDNSYNFFVLQKQLTAYFEISKIH